MMGDPTLKKAMSGLLWLFAIMATTLFIAAGTLRFWQGWLYLVVFFGSALVMTSDLAKNNPKLLERRSNGGLLAEGTTTRKIIMTFASAGFVALLIVSALDLRFGWSAVPAFVSLISLQLVAYRSSEQQ
jgi:hypothetical protein